VVLPFLPPQHIVVQAFWEKAVLPAIEVENLEVQKATICKPSLQRLSNENWRGEASNLTLPDPLGVQILNTPHGLNVADLSEVPLGR